MARNTKNLLSALAVLAVTSADAAAIEFLATASRVARSLGRCESTADDLVGDTALKFWSRHRDVLAKGEFKSYLETSVRNGWRDRMRAPRTTAFSELQDLPEPGSEAQTFASPTGDGDAQSVATVDEFRGTLTPSESDVLTHLESGHTDREIADRMSRTRYWVRGTVQRLRQKAETYFGSEIPDKRTGRARGEDQAST